MLEEICMDGERISLKLFCKSITDWHLNNSIFHQHFIFLRNFIIFLLLKRENFPSIDCSWVNKIKSSLGRILLFSPCTFNESDGNSSFSNCKNHTGSVEKKSLFNPQCSNGKLEIVYKQKAFKFSIKNNSSFL